MAERIRCPNCGCEARLDEDSGKVNWYRKVDADKDKARRIAEKKKKRESEGNTTNKKPRRKGLLKTLFGSDDDGD